MDTIFALSSGMAKAGVAVIRISGNDVCQVISNLTKLPVPKPRMASLRKIYDGEQVLDNALVLYFKGPNSFTGEDVAELHVHGGRAVIDSVLSAIEKQDGCRFAEPGEFSRRSFENGKMDLTKIEAIADLIDAETKEQAKQALRQMEGALGDLYNSWREKLKNALAYVEAKIDFAEEEDIKGNIQVYPAIEQVLQELINHLNDNHKGEKLREGISIALLGKPNVGKSQLLNAIAKRDAAIVSDIAGTTRDIIDIHLDLNGYPAIISDTAGIRAEAENVIEDEGIKRSLKKAEHADIKIVLFDAGENKIDKKSLEIIDKNTIVVLNKIDSVEQSKQEKDLIAKFPNLIKISALKNINIDVFMDILTKEVKDRVFGSESATITRKRHRSSLKKAEKYLKKSLEDKDLEFQAEDIRQAVNEIGKITGKVNVEELLDVIFSDFCIGK